MKVIKLDRASVHKVVARVPQPGISENSISKEVVKSDRIDLFDVSSESFADRSASLKLESLCWLSFRHAHLGGNGIGTFILVIFLHLDLLVTGTLGEIV